MAALVARISARRRRMTNTVTADPEHTAASGADHPGATSDWSDAASEDSDGEFNCPSPKRLAAEIVKKIPWSNGRARIDPFSEVGCNLSGVHESDADGGAAHSRSETPMMCEKALDWSGMDGVDRSNCSGLSVGSSASNPGKMSLLGALLQPNPLALSDNITSRRGSRGNHSN